MQKTIGKVEAMKFVKTQSWLKSDHCIFPLPQPTLFLNDNDFRSVCNNLDFLLVNATAGSLELGNALRRENDTLQ